MTTNQISYQNMMEKVRADQAVEMETRRHNQAIEDYNAGLISNQRFANEETKRHNTVMESLQNRINEINAWKASIDARANELQYQLGMTRATEEQRHNEAQELLTSTRNAQDYAVGSTRNYYSYLGSLWTHEDTATKLGIEQFRAETEAARVNNEAILGAANTATNVVTNLFSAAFKAGSSLLLN